jgi:hypothetical protein
MRPARISRSFSATAAQASARRRSIRRQHWDAAQARLAGNARQH